MQLSRVIYIVSLAASCISIDNIPPGETNLPTDIPPLPYLATKGIGKYLSGKDIGNVKLVCKEWYLAFDFDWNDPNLVCQYVTKNAASLVFNEDTYLESTPNRQFTTIIQCIKNLRIARQNPHIMATLIGCGQEKLAIQILTLKQLDNEDSSMIHPDVLNSSFLNSCRFGQVTLLTTLIKDFPSTHVWVVQAFYQAIEGGSMEALDKLFSYPEFSSTLQGSPSLEGVKVALMKRQEAIALYLLQHAWMQKLLEQNAVITAEILKVTFEGCFQKVVEWFFHQGLDPNFQRGEPLNWSAKSNKVQCLDILFSKGARANSSALFAAVQGDAVDSVIYLLKQPGIDVKAENNKALELSSINGNVAIAEILLDNGADIHARGDIAIQIASTKDMEKFLLGKGADLEARTTFESRLWI